MKTPKAKTDLGWIIKALADEAGVEVVQELAFAKPRRFRFDWAFPSLKIAIEYEGVFAARWQSGKSRHTTPLGYSNDCVKYNLAALDGWCVLRFTSKSVSSATAQIQQALKIRKGKSAASIPRRKPPIPQQRSAKVIMKGNYVLKLPKMY